MSAQNKKIAFVFPGQGSQAVGMGRDIYESYESARKIFDQADEVLGYKISDLCFYGPEEDLKLTMNTQPAILTVSTALYSILENEGITPDFLAGHSLGEYAALSAAGAFSFKNAVRLVHVRGKYMQAAVPAGEGTMAAIIGLENQVVEEICLQAGGTGEVELANYNCPGQLVIAGKTPVVKKAVELAKERGARMAVLLQVSGPFHSSLLIPASQRLKEYMDNIMIKNAKVPVMANVNAQLVTEADSIRSNLIEQIYNPVLWQQSVEKLLENGTGTIVEIGPGKVLSGLIKKVDKSVEMYNIENVTGLQNILPLLKRR